MARSMKRAAKAEKLSAALLGKARSAVNRALLPVMITSKMLSPIQGDSDSRVLERKGNTIEAAHAITVHGPCKKKRRALIQVLTLRLDEVQGNPIPGISQALLRGISRERKVLIAKQQSVLYAAI